jgi:hypothetical protein
MSGEPRDDTGAHLPDARGDEVSGRTTVFKRWYPDMDVEEMPDTA